MRFVETERILELMNVTMAIFETETVVMINVKLSLVMNATMGTQRMPIHVMKSVEMDLISLNGLVTMEM